MLHLVTPENRALYRDALDDMHRIRKAVFVDELNWKIPVTNGREYDQYDDDLAIYGLGFDVNNRVTMSARYRPTADRSLLTDVFAHAISPGTGRVTGPDVWEITRGICLETGGLRHNQRRRAMQMLAPIELAQAHGGTACIAFAEVRLLPLFISMGWRIELLGDPTSFGDGEGIAFRIEVSQAAIDQIRDAYDLPDPSYIELPVDARDARDVHQRALDYAGASPDYASTLPQLGDRRVVKQNIMRTVQNASLNKRAFDWAKKNQYAVNQ